MTLGGRLRKACMQCYCVRWRRAGLHGMKPKRLTVFAELTLIGRPPYLKVHIVTKSRAPKTNQCHVGIIRKVLALIRAIMTLVADCICTFVAIAIHRAKVCHIRLKTARKQKTSRAVENNNENNHIFVTRVIVNASKDQSGSKNWKLDWAKANNQSYAWVLKQKHFPKVIDKNQHVKKVGNNVKKFSKIVKAKCITKQGCTNEAQHLKSSHKITQAGDL